MVKQLCFALLLLCSGVSHSQNKELIIPDGWRAPNNYDLSGGWIEHKTDDYLPYFIRYDLDQNGQLDDVRILLRNDNTKFGIWIFLSTSNGQVNYLIDELGFLDSNPQNWGLSLTNTGKFQTACGKGYGDGCNPGELSEIEVKTPQLWYSPFESGPGFIVMWSPSERIFRQYWMSD